MTGPTQQIKSDIQSDKPNVLELIRDQILTVAASSITFSDIPQSYKHLRIEIVLRSDRAGSDSDGVLLKVNNDAGNNYDFVTQQGWHNNQRATVEQLAGAPGPFFYCGAATSTANYFSQATVTLDNYTSTSMYKTIQSRGTVVLTNTTGRIRIMDALYIWLNTTAISRLDIIPQNGTNFISGSRATLYGLK